MAETLHETLDCGMEWSADLIPDRHAVSFTLRVFAGTVHEPRETQGLAYMAQETITKGTEKHSGRKLSDAFDAIGASHSSWSGRESTCFACTCLPEFLQQALALHAEFLTTPTFPPESCSVAVELARQEIDALGDEPRELCDKLLNRQAYGPILGRHPLGEKETIDRIGPEHITRFWRENYAAGRAQLTLAGPIQPDRVRDSLESLFARFGSVQRAGRDPITPDFNHCRSHHHQQTEQQQIGICYPGVAVQSDEFATERVMLGVLSGGMSSRLFAQVREKLGLAYYVSAWSEHPRACGMIHVAASTTPQRCEQTYSTILREIERLAEDLSEDELQRAKTGILARTETRGDLTSARCAELSADLFHYGRPVPTEKKIERVRAVSVEDVKKYLLDHPRDRLSVVTLGPTPIEELTPVPPTKPNTKAGMPTDD